MNKKPDYINSDFAEFWKAMGMTPPEEKKQEPKKVDLKEALTEAIVESAAQLGMLEDPKNAFSEETKQKRQEISNANEEYWKLIFKDLEKIVPVFYNNIKQKLNL